MINSISHESVYVSLKEKLYTHVLTAYAIWSSSFYSATIIARFEY